MTESPRRNILGMKRSRFTGLAFFLPLPVLGNSVHISLTFSRTMLQCRSKALTRPRSFLLLRQLMSTCVLLRTDCVNTDKGPVLNSSSSFRSSSSGVISDLDLVKVPAMMHELTKEERPRFPILCDLRFSDSALPHSYSHTQTTLGWMIGLDSVLSWQPGCYSQNTQAGQNEGMKTRGENHRRRLWTLSSYGR